MFGWRVHPTKYVKISSDLMAHFPIKPLLFGALRESCELQPTHSRNRIQAAPVPHYVVPGLLLTIRGSPINTVYCDLVSACIKQCPWCSGLPTSSLRLIALAIFLQPITASPEVKKQRGWLGKPSVQQQEWGNLIG
ncbi:hypothetical protein Bbelb_185070 [Branchiostoma belcheri]|nr:hypothetical protein Bbelb_185070 [Branchiostoma belcheri]